ncbi:MAG: DUF1343 domain-containing protein [Bryobacterales bacterium]|nr:DUF1343 domain-containing protein [Bryobacterales bacterium]
MKRFPAFLALLAIASAQDFPQGSADLDRVIEDAIAKDQIPGAVLLVARKGRVLHRKAYGSRALVPVKEPMTQDTVFDAASLTKVVATTASIMKLFEQGRLRLADKVTDHLAEFQNGKSDITIRHLLTHFSGLRPDVDLDPPWSGYETGIKLALLDKPASAPGERFVYSDINFVLLGEIVRKLGGKTLSEYAAENVFRPLGMNETRYQPPASWRPRIAPTEVPKGGLAPLRGVVHDPTARNMGGVAGHAGLFTTAADLAKFAEMLLGLGEGSGVRLFSPATVRKFTSPNTPAGQPVLRGLGFDMDSPFSANRGELYPIGSFGHTGFTGTSMWIDPGSQSYVILLSNSVHPKLRPAITQLRARVATIVAAALGIENQAVALAGYSDTQAGPGVRRAVAHNGAVLSGLDVLAEQRFAALKGRRIGLITNHTGIDRDGRRNIDLMREAGVNLVGLFSPEHGIAGTEDHENVGNSKDGKTGIPVYSLYSGPNRKLSEAMLRGVDVLVFDIQDIGARFYTYAATLGNAMEVAAKLKLPFYVLDRPNPVNGVTVEGPMLDADQTSFIGYVPMPLRHGMTIGELARFFNAERGFGCDLRVIKMKNWQRGDWFDSTGQRWIDPSPSMRSLNAATLYTAIAMIEFSTNYSVGRGTDAPFEQVGSDWMHARELAAYLNGRMIPGVRIYPTTFKPAAYYFKDKQIEGLRFVVTDRESLQTSRLGLEIMAALEKFYPGKIPFDKSLRLIGSRAVIEAIKRGDDPRAIYQSMATGLDAFLETRRKHLLY